MRLAMSFLSRLFTGFITAVRLHNCRRTSTRASLKSPPPTDTEKGKSKKSRVSIRTPVKLATFGPFSVTLSWS